jgi:hypothetical protein
VVGPHISDFHPATAAAKAANKIAFNQKRKQSATRDIRLCPSIDNGVSKSSNNGETAQIRDARRIQQ